MIALPVELVPVFLRTRFHRLWVCLTFTVLGFASSQLPAQSDATATSPAHLPTTAVAAESAAREKWPAEVHVDGRFLRRPDGTEVWLQGVNVPGLEFTLRNEPVLEAMLVAIDQWRSNTIRLPIKETYWYGQDPAQQDGGEAYRRIVDQAVMLAANRGVYLVLDLHQFRAIKAEHVAFWKDAAVRYKNHPAVLFDIINEPHTISWEVWRDGGWVEDRTTAADEDAFLSATEKAKARRGFESPGMQNAVDAIRATGARNVIIAGGLDWAYDLSGVVDGFALSDPSGNGIMYASHIYNWKRDWANKVMRAAERFPIFVGETGADTKRMPFVALELQEDPYTWAPDMIGLIQQHQLHWTAWSFHPVTTPVLVKDRSYEPTPFWGAFVRAALAGAGFKLQRMR